MLSRFVKPVSLLLVSSMVGVIFADPTDIHQNDGVQIVFTQDYRADFNEPGDRVMARVDKDPMLPRDTILTGTILRVHPANRYRAASMDMVFTNLQLPHGPNFRIDAVPTPTNDPHLARDSDGRLVAAYKPGEDAAYTFGGTVGGLILGGIGHRPIRGAIIGTIIGSIAGAFDRQANANLVIRKGAKMVAIFRSDVLPAPPNNYGWRRRDGSDSPPIPRSAPSAIPQVMINGSPVKFSDSYPYRDGGQVMVPLEYTADQLNLVATVHNDGSITLDGPDASLQLRMNSTYCSGAGAKGDLSHPVQNHVGVVYAPIEVFAKMISDPITVDGNRVGS